MRLFPEIASTISEFLDSSFNSKFGINKWIVWVVVERGEKGPYYYGVAGSEIRVDRSIKRAYNRCQNM